MGGPGTKYHETSESFKVMKMLIDGTIASGCPRFGIPIVDIRDVSQAHIAAAYNESASGRYILSGYNTNLYEMGELLREKSKFANKGYGFPHDPSRGGLCGWSARTQHRPWNELRFTITWMLLSISITAKPRKNSGLCLIDHLKTMEDMIDQLIEVGAVEEKKGEE